MQAKKKLLGIFRNAIILLVGVLFFIPLYMVLVNTFKGSEEIVSTPLGLPLEWTWDNLKAVFMNPYTDIWAMYGNTIFITVLGVVLVVLLSSTTGYYIARSRRTLARKLYIYFLLGMMVPYIIVYVPLVVMFRLLGLAGSKLVLILVFVVANLPFSTFMYKGFVESTPRELEEAAAIDGASPLQIFFLIIFPLLKPCTLTVVIFTCVGIWNDYLTPSIISQVQTITVGIYTAIGPHSADWGLVFAYVFAATVPMLILYILLQKHFINGLSNGALKG